MPRIFRSALLSRSVSALRTPQFASISRRYLRVKAATSFFFSFFGLESRDEWTRLVGTFVSSMVALIQDVVVSSFSEKRLILGTCNRLPRVHSPSKSRIFSLPSYRKKEKIMKTSRGLEKMEIELRYRVKCPFILQKLSRNYYPEHSGAI